MAMNRVLLALDGDDIAPRFDLAPEVLIVTLDEDGQQSDVKDLVLARPSAEMLCHVVAAENVETVVCGGIEDEYLQYLEWKKVRVIHSVIGGTESIFDHLREGTLKPGDILTKGRSA